MSSRLEDLRDLAHLLDEGKITQREYDIVKKELIEAPAEDWELNQVADDPGPDVEDTEPSPPGQETSWLDRLRRLPTTYRAAGVVALLVLVIGSFIASRTDTAGTVIALPSRDTSGPAEPPADSLQTTLGRLAEGWNEVENPPLISGGITTSPEPGALDSFLYRFNDSAFIAGGYDPDNDYIYALMLRSNLHYEPASNLYIHLCHLLHPGSPDCLETFIEETGMFGRSHSELIGMEQSNIWSFAGQTWEFGVANDVETMRVRT